MFTRVYIISKIKLPAFIVDWMYRLNIMDIVRPAVMKIMNLVVGEAVRDLDQLERMKSPRVFKTHLPLYLLHPELLDTSKVSRGKKQHLLEFAFTFLWSVDPSRLSTSLETRKMSSSRTSTFTSWWININSPAILSLSPTTLWKTEVTDTAVIRWCHPAFVSTTYHNVYCWDYLPFTDFFTDLSLRHPLEVTVSVK